MSAPSILFDAPGPRTVRRHRLYTVLGLVLLVLVIGFVLQRLYAAGTFAYDQWEVFVTPRFIEVILVDGVLATLKMAGAAVALSVVVGLVLGVAKLADRAWIRVPATVVVEFFRAVPVLLLMILFFFTFGINGGQSRRLLERRAGADALQRLGAGRDLPRRHQRRAEGPVRGGVRPGDAQEPGHQPGAAAAGGEDHAARRSSASAWWP